MDTNIIGSSLDGLANLGVHAIPDIHDRGGFLEDTECLDEGRRKPFSGTTDVKVL